MAGLRYQHIIFNTHADVPPFFGKARLRREIQSRFNGHNHARFQHAPLIAYLIFADVVYVHTQPVPGFVHEIATVSLLLYQGLRFSLENSQLNHAFGQHFNRRVMGLRPVMSRPHCIDCSLLRGQDKLVHRFLPAAEAAVDRERTGYVTRIAFIFSTGVNQ